MTIMNWRDQKIPPTPLTCRQEKCPCTAKDWGNTRRGLAHHGGTGLWQKGGEGQVGKKKGMVTRVEGKALKKSRRYAFHGNRDGGGSTSANKLLETPDFHVEVGNKGKGGARQSIQRPEKKISGRTVPKTEEWRRGSVRGKNRPEVTTNDSFHNPPNSVERKNLSDTRVAKGGRKGKRKKSDLQKRAKASKNKVSPVDLTRIREQIGQRDGLRSGRKNQESLP